MEKMRTFAIYAILIAIFFAFSSFLIEVGLNTNYDKMDKKEIANEIEITHAEATFVNGRIMGKLKGNVTEELYSKYIKIDIYSPRDVLLGTKYIEIKDLLKTSDLSFKTYFELQDAKYYNISIVDNKTTEESKEAFKLEEMTKFEILVGVVIALMFV